ncbi:MAG: DUF493 domain-containing protein [Proteobacteria bacterium]|nr:DUF493 domain-containing protein [Pseudomonadota bacterium]MBU1716315.1 DUF493 domain-containing protein [Pseudomonadota bacterium]
MFAGCKYQKLELEYPCNWQYKVIGEDHEKMRLAIAEFVQDVSCSINHSKSSSSGKYHSLNLEIVVESEEVRILIYQELKNHPAVKMVL